MCAFQIIALIQALSECHSAIVEQLNVSTNSFSNVDLTKLVSSLRVDEIVSLDVSCNVVGSSTAVELRDLILNEVANLQVCLQPGDCDQIMCSTCTQRGHLGWTLALQDLNLNSCHIRRGQFDTLCAAFERGHTLRRLNLGRNNIDDSMASKLLECIRESRIEVGLIPRILKRFLPFFVHFFYLCRWYLSRIFLAGTGPELEQHQRGCIKLLRVQEAALAEFGH